MAVLIMNKISLRRLPYAELLKDLDEEMVLLCDPESLAPEDRPTHERTYANIVEIPRYEFSGEVELAAIELHEKTPFRRIIAVSESDLLRAARLREHLGIEGQSYASARAYRDKVEMKEILRAAGLRVPEARRVREVTDIVEFAQRRGFPVVVKPTMGQGSVDTAIVRNKEQLRQLLARGFGSSPEASFGLEVEEFIDGRMYHVDGFLRGGKTIACWPAAYINTCPDFVSGGKAVGSYLLPASDPLTPRLRQATQRVLDALPTPEDASFHAEFFHTKDDDLVVCEIASRVGGPMVPDAWRAAFDVDLPEVFVRALAGLRDPVPPAALAAPKQLAGFVLVPPKKGVFAGGPSESPFAYVTQCVVLGEKGHTYSGSSDLTSFLAGIVYTGGSRSEMEERAAAILEWFEGACAWRS